MARFVPGPHPSDASSCLIADVPTPVHSPLIDQLTAALGPGYSIERELGGGGMSRVFVAFDADLERRVAVKVMPEHLAASVSVDRFKREILLSAGLQHPHIVGVLSAGVFAGLPYFVMPYVEGESLGTRLESGGALSVRQTVSILKDVSRALAYAHERGVVHRDIKPGNIMVVGRQAKVMDFGIARMRANDNKTSTGIVLGTPKYMSPEQAAGEPVDHRSDIFSLGIVFYEMLTGVRLFAGDDVTQIVHNLTHLEHEPPTRLNPKLPAMLDFVVARALKKDPAVRYQDAYELAADLATCLAELQARELAEQNEKNAKDLTRTMKLEAGAAPQDAPAARAIAVDTRLPLSRQFDSSAALERLERPARRDRDALARAPKPVGILRRLWNDGPPRRVLVVVMAAAIASGYIAFG
jgi:serine/threonine protein kinase